MAHRLENLRAQMKEQNLDAILVSSPENRRYLSGFTGSAGYLFVSHQQAVLATDFRYTEQASGQAPHFQVARTGPDWAWLVELLKDSGVHRVGFESQHITVHTYHQIGDILKQQLARSRPNMVAVPGMLEVLRTVKDGEELAVIQRAIDIADGAMQAVAPAIQVGDTEREVAWRLDKAMRELGADGPSFDTIVASGPNGAMPHHQPSDRPIAAGEPTVIDMGARVDGYCSDITRTVCVGQPDDTFRRIYDIVLGAQLTAIATVKPGMSGGDCDGLSRTVIAEAGYGESFGHSLGHGLGLAVHEFPRVSPNAANLLEEGMVFTVEPGIYLSGWGGVRIEDDVVLEAGGARVLSRSPK